MSQEGRNEQEYLEQQRLLVEGESAQAGRLDKSLLTLAAGAFVLSITFIRELVPDPQGVGWLAGAWWLFAASIALNLLSMLTSQFAYQRQRTILNQSWNKKISGEGSAEVDSTTRNPWSWRTQGFNIAALGFFLLGLVSIMTFSCNNMQWKQYEESTMADTPEESAGDQMEKGAVPPATTEPSKDSGEGSGDGPNKAGAVPPQTTEPDPPKKG